MQNYEEIHEKIPQSCCDKTCSGGFFSEACKPCYHNFISPYSVFFILEILALKMNRAQAVPDLEPSLLNSNSIEPNKLQIMFRPSRKYTASTHVIHVPSTLTSHNFWLHQTRSFISTTTTSNSGQNHSEPKMNKLLKSADPSSLTK
jgi:hypothetical protein